MFYDLGIILSGRADVTQPRTVLLFRFRFAQVDQSAAYIESLKPLHSISAGTPNLEIADASMKPLFHLGLLRLQ